MKELRRKEEVREGVNGELREEKKSEESRNKI